MKQEFLKNQKVKGRLIPGLVLIGCFGLAAILGTPDQEPVERARMYQGTISQQPTYEDSLNYEGK